MSIQYFRGKSTLFLNSVLLCSASLLASCGGSSDSGNIIEPVTPPTVEPTPAPVPTPTPDSTATPAPTAAPTTTPTAIPTAAPTSAPTSAPTATPTDVPVVDDDNDGVANAQDQCLDTAADVAVDSKGCELSLSINIVGDCKMTKTQQDLLDALNETRAVAKTCGTNSIQAAATPFNWDCQLVNAAVGHATDMATNNFYSLEGSNGSSFADRIIAAGYVDNSASAEMIASGETDATATVDNWVNNTDNCMTIMNPHYIDIGVGFAENSSSDLKYYWTASFGNREKK